MSSQAQKLPVINFMSKLYEINLLDEEGIIAVGKQAMFDIHLEIGIREVIGTITMIAFERNNYLKATSVTITYKIENSETSYSFKFPSFKRSICV
jgi:hypothetical protein